jgi:hypothetical protein
MVTLDTLRHTWTADTRAKLKAQGCPDGDLERLTSAHMSTISDEYLNAAWQQAGRDIAARKAAEDLMYAEQHAQDLAAQKATKAHQNRLAVAHRATEVERGRAEEAEAKVRELNRVLDDGSH